MAAADNQRALEKVTTGDFTGAGSLKEEEFDDFFLEVQNTEELLGTVRMMDVNAPTGDIPKLGVGERLLQAVNENSNVSLQSVNSGSIGFATTKVGLPYELTRETVEDVIDDPAGSIRDLFTQQFAVDTADLAVNGDETADDGTSPTAEDQFYGINDGWLKIADDRGAPSYDHSSAAVDNDLFHNMVSALDQKYKRQNNLVFMMSQAQKENYKYSLVNRSTSAGDDMLMTDGQPTPYGFDIVTPPNFPDDRAMLVNPDKLIYIVQRDMEVRSTQDGSAVVLNDKFGIYNLLARIDFQIEDENAMVVADNIA